MNKKHIDNIYYSILYLKDLLRQYECWAEFIKNISYTDIVIDKIMKNRLQLIHQIDRDHEYHHSQVIEVALKISDLTLQLYKIYDNVTEKITSYFKGLEDIDYLVRELQSCYNQQLLKLVNKHHHLMNYEDFEDDEESSSSHSQSSLTDKSTYINTIFNESKNLPSSIREQTIFHSMQQLQLQRFHEVKQTETRTIDTNDNQAIHNATKIKKNSSFRSSFKSFNNLFYRAKAKPTPLGVKPKSSFFSTNSLSSTAFDNEPHFKSSHVSEYSEMHGMHASRVDLNDHSIQQFAEVNIPSANFQMDPGTSNHSIKYNDEADKKKNSQMMDGLKRAVKQLKSIFDKKSSKKILKVSSNQIPSHPRLYHQIKSMSVYEMDDDKDEVVPAGRLPSVEEWGIDINEITPQFPEENELDETLDRIAEFEDRRRDLQYLERLNPLHPAVIDAVFQDEDSILMNSVQVPSVCTECTDRSKYANASMVSMVEEKTVPWRIFPVSEFLKDIDQLESITLFKGNVIDLDLVRSFPKLVKKSELISVQNHHQLDGIGWNEMNDDSFVSSLSNSSMCDRQGPGSFERSPSIPLIPPVVARPANENVSRKLLPAFDLEISPQTSKESSLPSRRQQPGKSSRRKANQVVSSPTLSPNGLQSPNSIQTTFTLLSSTSEIYDEGDDRKDRNKVMRGLGIQQVLSIVQNTRPTLQLNEDTPSPVRRYLFPRGHDMMGYA